MNKKKILYSIFIFLISINSNSNPLTETNEYTNSLDIKISLNDSKKVKNKYLDHPLYEKVLKQGVPEEALSLAFDFYNNNINSIRNKNFLTVVDFSVHSSQKRKYIINLESGSVEILLAAHGTGSDPHHSGFAEKFSNTPNSKMTSLGFYLTAEPYNGKYGLSMRLDGLEKSNNKARERAIVVHGANYVNPNQSPIGRSWGCPAVEMSQIKKVVNQLKNGSLYFVWHPEIK